MIRADRPARRPSLVTLLVVSAACNGALADQSEANARVFAYDRSRALDLRESAVSESGTASLSSISFASPGGGRVTGFIAVPKSSGRHAGVVVMHGLPGTAQGAINGEGLSLAARGAVAIAIDAPWARRGGMPAFTEQDSVEQVQLIQDLQRAVDVLLARHDVDPARLAYVGGSYGGAMGSLFAGIERRLKAFVLFVPDGGLVSHFTDAQGRVTGPVQGLPAAAQTRWLAAMRPIEPILFIGRAAPAALLFQNGRQDQLVSVEDAEALHAAAPEPKTIRWYDAGHGLTPDARAERWAWLAPHIGTSP